MTRPLHRGRPGTRILPADWADQVSPTITEDLTESGCTVTIRSLTTGTGSHWDNDAGRTVTTPPAAAYTGPAALTAVAANNEITVAVDDLVETRMYAIQLPATTVGIREGQQVTIDTNPDPELVGRTLDIKSVEHDTRRLSRVLYAVLND